MHILKTPLFIICCLLFLVHQFFQKILHIYHPVPDSYLDNLVAMPIVLSLLLLERRLLYNRYYKFIGFDIMVITVYISLISEFIFPFFSKRFVYDPFDILCYGLGSALFYYTLNKNFKA